LFLELAAPASLLLLTLPRSGDYLARGLDSGGEILKRLLVVLLALVGPLFLTQISWATGTTWTGGTGAGSDNLPCALGGYWLLTGAENITSATLTFNGTDHEMRENKAGDFVAYTFEPLEAGDVVRVTFVGSGQPVLTLSHCVQASPSPSESPSESVSPSESPSESVSPSESPSESVSPSGSVSPSQSSSPTPTPSVLGESGSRGPSQSPTGTAFTGSNVTPFAALAGGLAVVGLALLYFVRRRAAEG
jgi:LPXTG-motif cell wall-anchored protein